MSCVLCCVVSVLVVVSGLTLLIFFKSKSTRYIFLKIRSSVSEGSVRLDPFIIFNVGEGRKERMNMVSIYTGHQGDIRTKNASVIFF